MIIALQRLKAEEGGVKKILRGSHNTIFPEDQVNEKGGRVETDFSLPQ